MLLHIHENHDDAFAFDFSNPQKIKHIYADYKLQSLTALIAPTI